ncbi:hypothetical protein M758_2G080700 [Ceratodon purpureus]|nr:hypothetical protein M758_2G080700 [Ceratodon purpureus]
MVLELSSSASVRPPLSTSSRWVVDRLGVQVKLACVTWVGHLEVSKNTAQGIAALIKANDFNCVQLTSSTALCADDTHGAGLTVAQNFNNLNIQASSLAWVSLRGTPSTTCSAWGKFITASSTC